jgi:hypothetical protein
MAGLGHRHGAERLALARNAGLGDRFMKEDVYDWN